LISTVSPGFATLTAAWMEWPGHTTMTDPALAGAAALAGSAAIAAAPYEMPSTHPSAAAHTA
jgi:hypothetical protein